MSLILAAAALARDAHRGQVRKYNSTPYALHPARVASRVAMLEGATEVMVAAAFLHDVLEDTTTSYADICACISPEVADFVLWMTNPSKTHPKMARADRKKMDREHLAIAPRAIKQIKMLDRIDNLNEMIGADRDFSILYAQESRLLADAIGDADAALCRELFKAADLVANAATKPRSRPGETLLDTSK